MKHHSSKLFAALVACAASAGALAQTAPAAAPSFKITVTGTIAPGSCTPSSGDLTFDMKSINPKSLNADKVTTLSGITQKVKITCTADTAIALNVTGSTKASGKAYGSNMDNHPAGTSTYEASLYDLVNPSDSNSRVGVYAMQFRNFTYTGGGTGSVATKAVVIKSDDKVSWSYSDNLNGWDTAQLKRDGSNYVSFADTKANTVPVLASTFEGDLMISPLILAKKDLKLTGDLKFEGGATITLNYL
ncbi:hypothetical protein [Achromobacter sp. UMC71]|uniref:hypothetical protein n=1 Tax=Achromobacter sp. UMC71 TaxID=1862320 RepID=UPI0016017267|nr:hypothetical protein [Achromobacter sp. UMC71]MBB1627539.1 hypothetical protein [Achromobacter sp. UMC71]